MTTGTIEDLSVAPSQVNHTVFCTIQLVLCICRLMPALAVMMLLPARLVILYHILYNLVSIMYL